VTRPPRTVRWRMAMEFRQVSFAAWFSAAQRGS
jgi:hypothetical protein